MSAGEVIVVGAGVSGLTLAHELASDGVPVTVVERAGAVGGLARTFRWADRAFDVGPHRFHTEDARVAAFVEEVVGGELLRVPRASAVRAFGRTHPWPLRARVLAELPPSVTVRAAIDLLRRRPPAGESFESEIVSRYGRTLYAAFFGPYTERFSGSPGDRLHRDWARASIDRAVIDRRVRAGGLGSLARGALLPARQRTELLYPAGGVGRFAERLAERLVEKGGRLLLGREVTALECAGARVRAIVAGGERLPVRGIVWTGPLASAARAAGVDGAGLRTRATLLYNLALSAPSRLGYQWVYLAEEPSLQRVSDPTRFSPAAAPAGAGALCAEATCEEGDAAWDGAERRAGAVVDTLLRNGFVRSAREVTDVRVERVRDTYPVYDLAYRDRRRRARAALASLRNLALAGRGGCFWYNNMDHSIGQALRIAEAIRRSPGDDLSEIAPGALDYWEAAP